MRRTPFLERGSGMSVILYSKVWNTNDRNLDGISLQSMEWLGKAK